MSSSSSSQPSRMTRPEEESSSSCSSPNTPPELSSCAATSEPPLKRQKVAVANKSLSTLCSLTQWDAAQRRAETHPEEAARTSNVANNKGVERRGSAISSTPLALACRLGAPLSCIRAILQASPAQVRRLIPSLGTPLHEAIVCINVEPGVIRLLLEKDEDLGGPEESRAALLQDVDGHTPLHLLIRRRFQLVNKSDGMAMLEALVRSCPAAMDVLDCGEYEEPPLVMALKASIYYHSPSDDYQGMEKYIYQVIQIMLSANPQAATRVLSGARGKYTPLHSAVFHGRCSDTIKLLLEADKTTTTSTLLLSNTQGELPLHFCAMRGEPPRSIELLSAAAPMAVLERDTSGQTPMHWLWIRFLSTLLSLEETRPNNATEETNVPVVRGALEQSHYLEWAQLERGDYYEDLTVVRKLDPPVDFLRMRHVPPELFSGRDVDWADRTCELLERIRNRYYSLREGRIQQEERNDMNGEAAENAEDDNTAPCWTRQEAVTALFWTKVVALLRAAASATQHDQPLSSFRVTHTAMSTFACPPAVTRIVTSLFPDELCVVDSEGKLPLHHAATRPGWEKESFGFARDNHNQAHPLKEEESLKVLKHAISVSPRQTARVADQNNRLALHLAIDTFVKACSRPSYYYWYSAASAPTDATTSATTSSSPVENMMQVLRELLKMYPDSLERRDGKTKLYPFLQATAAATEYKSLPSPNGYPVMSDEMPLSIVYLLLRENPSLVK